MFFIIFVFKFENTYNDKEILMNANKSLLWCEIITWSFHRQTQTGPQLGCVICMICMHVRLKEHAVQC